MGPLLRLFAWRHARRQPLRVLLACTSIALGVALLVAIECAHATVVSSLEATADQLSGSARFEVARTGHLQVDEAALPSIREVPGAIATPVVQGTVLGKEPRAGSLLLLGVDFRSDPRVRAYATEGNVELSPLVVELARGRAAMVPKRFADKFGLAIGSWIEVETRTGTTNLPIAAILRDEGPARVFGGNLVIVDVANARSILGREPRGFDRIEVAPDGITADELRARLAIALKDGYEIRDLRRRPAVVENVLVPLRSLISISAMALVVALFLVTNTVALSVTERTRE
ncbi:MAG TPA: ABC transporter permease, partial [Planctomycetota bacterium]|nr:ABC transporter permease [Planctomycetota bacterium]